MMSASQNLIPDVLAAALPPLACFRVGNVILAVARGLFQRGVIGACGIKTALNWAHFLSQVGMHSWRVRKSWRHR
jgi:hypothetical protein